MKISIIAANTSQRGPGKVYQNLMLGLNNFSGIVARTNDPVADYFGYLQDTGVALQLDSTKTLFGPNLFVLPSENKSLCSHIKSMVVPSNWVLNLYRGYTELDHVKIDVWSSGIDTKEWRPNSEIEKDLDCFVYFKNREEIELKTITGQLDSLGLKYEVIRYGSYTENDLYKLCNRAKFAILLTGTESQGIAYMQILAMNVPCYVFNKTIWTSEDGKVSVPATSVPYFDNKCGIINNDNLIVDKKLCIRLSFDYRKLNIESYKTPRTYIEEQHNIITSAKKYIELVRNIK